MQENTKISTLKHPTEDNLIKKPSLNDEAIINYKMFLNKESKILLESKENFRFKINSNKIIKGLSESVLQMSLGETSIFKIPSVSAFPFGCEFIGINPNDCIEMEIELIEFYQKNKSRYEMTLIEKIEFAKSKKVEGIEMFKQKKYFEASNIFDEAVGYLQSEPELVNQEDKDLLISLLLNLSNCLNNLKRFEETLVKCAFVLTLKNHPKAFYYRGIALCNIPTDNNLKLAESDLASLKELISGDDAGLISLEELINNKKIYLENSQKNLYKNLFKNKSVYEDKKMKIHPKIPQEIGEFNPKVFFEIKVGTDDNNDMAKEYGFQTEGRVEFELFANVVPKTAENFLLLTTTNKYKDCIFHRLIKDFMIQGGDYENFNGTGGASIYGKHFADENFDYEHTQAGLLSMANSGANKNGSQFFITFKETPWLNGKHVVFGRVIKGLDFIMSLNKMPTGDEDRPTNVIKIINCGRIE